ncbi:sugar transferase [Daejeonella oryzae]|uniref:sugar transferase n=1 Tax=Daejeonella oryzae TaxID=1122943 RepID=UPI00055E7F23|nr:sugar transferase [Daejeonella oryzae]
MYKLFFKRLIDFICSILIFILISPIFIIAILVLSIYYRGNPFFTQNRPGLNGKIFRLLKFKSMVNKYDADGELLPDADRITSAGKFIRKTSIDEIPQLLNVLIGDMSFIGPRPLLENYLYYYTEREHTRHHVRPGISGLAQVSGRNNIELPQRLELDVQYVETLSFINDCKIALKTIHNVVSGKDITVVTSLKTLKDYRNKNPHYIPS